jgi:hypothetical protein
MYFVGCEYEKVRTCSNCENGLTDILTYSSQKKHQTVKLVEVLLASGFFFVLPRNMGKDYLSFFLNDYFHE